MDKLNVDIIDSLKLYNYSKYLMLFIVVGLLSTSAFCIYSTNYINYKNNDNNNKYFNNIIYYSICINVFNCFYNINL